MASISFLDLLAFGVTECHRESLLGHCLISGYGQSYSLSRKYTSGSDAEWLESTGGRESSV